MYGTSMERFFWTQKQDIGASPRTDHSICYDSHKEKVLLFGGLAANTSRLGDTWMWNGNEWTQVADTGPSPRSGFDMVYDSFRKKSVLFGGFAGGLPTDHFNDTWEWDGNEWTQVADTGPSARRNHAMAYDSTRHRVILFGGAPFNGPFFKDTWEWDGNEWTQVADTGPSARHAHTMTYDESAQIVLLFSGATLTGGSVGETWGWDGNEWTHLQDLGPGRLVGSPIVYTVHGTILFGGKMINDEVNDNTWLWDGQFWTHVQDMGPSAIFDHAMAYDSRRDRIVLFGGGGVAAGIPYLGDTWELKIEPMS